MAKAAIILFDLKTGRCSSTIQVRLLRFLESMNLRWGSELMGVDMFLLDSQSTMMPATVNVNRLAIHMPNLKVGSLYSLAGFDVTRCNQNYRLSDSSMMVRFSDSTCFDEITEPAIPIFPVHELLGLANTNTQLPDIIGEITAAKSTVTDPPHDKNHLMATIKMDNDVSVTMSMFDSQPVKLHNQLESMGGDPRVLVATSLNPKIVGGHLFLNATSGTRIYFDKETIAGETSTGWLPKTLGLRATTRRLISSAPRRSLVSSWTRDGATFLAPTVPRSSNALSRLSHVWIVIILMLLVF
ncbi:uncharacterized protein LOC106386605 isoform X1 [Brassica napus]|uniref:(rape) hypothetical protein n=2 Tax=Brassica napus TaxID=3708 RepID=A0A816X709_BRANA|nr:uncharacterized protein LOC106386605 isoform X1 [Brassica napus]XP_048614945.1 uncharacterized protein LOC106386605 isoform X1 [Brassica napus]CAF2142764.1 unnamed protein product [Brassica napus]